MLKRKLLLLYVWMATFEFFSKTEMFYIRVRYTAIMDFKIICRAFVASSPVDTFAHLQTIRTTHAYFH